MSLSLASRFSFCSAVVEFMRLSGIGFGGNVISNTDRDRSWSCRKRDKETWR
jgi:hypothetical protein